MRRFVSPLAGFLVGGLVGLTMLLSLGAAEGPDRRFPRHTVDAVRDGRELWITDNDTGKLYRYSDQVTTEGGTETVLVSTYELSQVGQAKLKPAAGEQ